MKSKTYIIIINVLILFNIFIFAYIIIKQQKISYEVIEDQNDYFYQVRKQILNLEHSNESLIFPDSVYIGCDTINVAKLNINKPTLIFYFSIQACTSCYQNVLEQIAHIFPDYADREDIIFLSNDLDYKLRENYYEKTIYANFHFRNNLAMENSSPSLFILNPDMKIDLFFIADKQTPEYTKEYLIKIKERFLQ